MPHTRDGYNSTNQILPLFGYRSLKLGAALSILVETRGLSYCSRVLADISVLVGAIKIRLSRC